MSSKIWWVLAGLAALTSSPAFTQVLHCKDLDPNHGPDIPRAFECVSRLDNDLEQTNSRMEGLEATLSKLTRDIAEQARTIDTLKGEIESAPTPGTIPKDVVMAFDTSNGCPSGWTPFADGQSRTIIGASFGLPDSMVGGVVEKQFKYRDHGGRTEVTLGIDEMPSHRHSIPLVSTQGSLPLRNAGEGQNIPYFDVPPVEAANGAKVLFHGGDDGASGVRAQGGNQPHENMPPYIALYFCKKT